LVNSDPDVLWLWCRPAAATPVRSLAQELPHAAGSALIRKKKKKKEKKRKVWTTQLEEVLNPYTPGSDTPLSMVKITNGVNISYLRCGKPGRLKEGRQPEIHSKR